MAFKKRKKVSDKKIWNTLISSCDGKNAYNTKADAEDAADRLWEQDLIDLKVYKCGTCLKWHLTSRK